MIFEIRHEVAGRIRLAVDRSRVPYAREIEQAALAVEGVSSAALTPRTGSLVVLFDGKPSTRRLLLGGLRRFAPSGAAPEPRPDGLREHENRLIVDLARFAFGRALSGTPALALAFYGALPYLREGLRSLASGRLDSQALDAAAITTAMRMGDTRTASTITALLKVGDYLRLRTESQARRGLTALLTDGKRPVWVLREGKEAQIAARDLRAGERVVVRSGSVIPVDGRVARGVAGVDQSSLTGEAMPARKRPGSPVYDGTVVVEGKLEIEALEVGARTRRSKILSMVQEGASAKASAERRADRLADGLTPWIFGVAGLTRALTGDPARAAAVMLVDYSCALKLSIPIAIKTGMIEAQRRGILVRGGRFLEALAEADTFVFDKTGTLTEARPRVVDVAWLPGFDRTELLKAVACVEEHFPHPVASALIQEAARHGILHADEEHGDVKCVVGYGLISSLRGKRLVVGSRRMLAEAGVSLRGAPEERLGRTAIYMAVGSKLAAVFSLEDPIRPEAPRVLGELRGLGIGRFVLLTGDGAANVRPLAGMGFDEWRAEMSPEQKADVVRRLRASGRKVAMIGDGMNDAPALAAADVGISFQHGTDIARETADVLILNPSLSALTDAVLLARATMERVRGNFRQVVGVNSALIIGAALGRASPSGSALAHNLATLGTSIASLRPYLRAP